MNHLMNITKKELKELLTPGSVISILIMVVMLMTVGTLVGGGVDDITSPSKIGFIDEDGGEWSDETVDAIYGFYMNTYDLTKEEVDEYFIVLTGQFNTGQDIVDAMNEAGLTTTLVLEKGYSSNIESGIRGSISEYYVYENKGLLGAASDSITSLVIPYISDYISYILISDITGGADTAFLMNPVKSSTPNTYINGELHSVAPWSISSAALGQNFAIPIVIMIVIMMIGSIVISSMGNEKENKTLETLLTLPVKRTTIVGGKLLASAITGLIFGMAYMLAMMTYMGNVTGSHNNVDLASLGLTLDAFDWILMMLMVFFAIFCALGLCMILGAFAKNYKAAQTMTLPISMLAMIPMFITIFTSWNALPGFVQGILFAIPFSHPMMAMDNLMFNNMDIVFGGLIYLVIFTIVTIAITVRLYNSDILLTGLKQTKAGKVFSWKKN